MISVIVISHNTPILLHSFLESLFHFSNFKMEDVNAVFIHRQNIRYNQVQSIFPNVKYFDCNENDDCLNNLVNNVTSDYLMICSDNVVFSINIDINDLENKLKKGLYYFDKDCLLAKTDLLINSVKDTKTACVQELFNNLKQAGYNSSSCDLINKISINTDSINFELTEALAYLFNVKNTKINFQLVLENNSERSFIDIEKLDIFPKKKVSFVCRLKSIIKKIIGKDKKIIKNVISDANCQLNAKKIPKILTAEESLDLLLEKPRSLARLGDNELLVINKEDATFQKYDPKLREYLIEILKNENDDIYCSIPYIYYHPYNMVDTVNKFQSDFGQKLNTIISQHCSYTNTYLDTSMSQAYQIYKDCDFDKFFNKTKQLFANKKISLVIGEGIYQKFEYSIFDQCIDFEIIEAPKFDAFSKLDYLMDEIGKREKDRIICVILGPAAKALTIEMTKCGYMVWDIGHLAKDYNAYKKQMPRTSDKVLDFFAPD